MRIFIDESGVFSAASGFCCIASLTVPESCVVPLSDLHARSMKRWSVKDELKGSKLNEKQYERVLRALSGLDVMLTVVGVDLSLNSDAAVTAHKQGQAAKVRDSVADPKCVATLRQQIEAMAARLEALPNQLYVQALVLSEVVHATLQAATVHYAQTEPTTLNRFEWRMDAKDKTLANYERLWLDVSRLLSSVDVVSKAFH